MGGKRKKRLMLILWFFDQEYEVTSRVKKDKTFLLEACKKSAQASSPVHLAMWDLHNVRWLELQEDESY